MKIGYEAGLGRTFTPSTNAKWIDSFNDMLNSDNLSRNALTEKLIEEGIRYSKKEYVIMEAEGLSQEQAALLSSKAGQEILKNVVNLLLGNSPAIIGGDLLKIGNESEVNSIVAEIDKKEPMKSGASALDKLKKKMNHLNETKEQI